VVFGDNGRGKTGIFRAVVFCLFGSRSLSQDDETPDEELKLVNAQELEDHPDEAVESCVELKFSHFDRRYTLSRTLAGMWQKGKAIEELRETKLQVQEPDGNTRTVSDPKNVAQEMKAVLDPRVSEYFLFDGEKMERLTRAGRQQRREVAKGLRNLLNIDALEVAITAAGQACKKLNSELQKKSTGEHARVLKQITDNVEEQEKARDCLKQVEEELTRAEAEKDDLDKKLAQFQEIRALLQERERLEKSAEEHKEQIKTLLSDIRNRIGKAALGLVKNSVQHVFEHIDERKKRGEIPPEIRKDLIDKLLEDGLCICGRELKPGSEAFKRIVEWRARSGDPGLQDSALELWRHLSVILQHHEEQGQSAEVALTRYAQANQALLQAQSRLEEVSGQIGRSERKDAAKLESQHKNVEKQIVRLEVEKQDLNRRQEELKNDYDRLDARRKELERDERLRNELVRRAELAGQVQKALSEVFEKFTDNIRDQIGRDATAVMQELLDEEGRRVLHEIVVNEDYSLQIMDRWGKPFLANISAGQRQIMSISFIAALARAAAGGGLLEMPLFMDTPFGRLSFEHRKNLIRQVPQLCAQWVLLATDTELRQREGTLLKSEGRWGRFYILDAREDGSTIIDERKPQDAVAILKENEEPSQ